MAKIIGRTTESQTLVEALKSKRPELIAVYGRRRVGKTYLIRQTYRRHIKFELTGIHKVHLKNQLLNFHLTLHPKSKAEQAPGSWIEAFHDLTAWLKSRNSSDKMVLFFDEFPWLDSRKSNFLPAFENFWNAFASKRNDLVVVICGSAASYMINKIIRSKGGLHNRLTHKLQLLPFNLSETEQLLQHQKVNLTRYDLVLMYMVFGGVPHYLEKIKSGESVAQAVNRLCFAKDGFLRTEFNDIFASLFERHENHDAIVRILAQVRKGLTRSEIQLKSKISSGGTLTKTLEELEQSGFIESYAPYTGVKNSLYRLTDEYSLFYLKFIESNRPSRGSTWLKIINQQSFKSWSGFSFESICIKHMEQLLHELKIAGIGSTHSSWTGKADNDGTQIDLLIDRDDNVINLCEMKFYNTEFAIDKKYADQLVHKVNTFKNATKTKKSIFITFITSFGLKPNKYSNQIVQNELTMDCLFKSI